MVSLKNIALIALSLPIIAACSSSPSGTPTQPAAGAIKPMIKPADRLVGIILPLAELHMFSTDAQQYVGVHVQLNGGRTYKFDTQIVHRDNLEKGTVLITSRMYRPCRETPLMLKDHLLLQMDKQTCFYLPVHSNQADSSKPYSISIDSSYYSD